MAKTCNANDSNLASVDSIARRVAGGSPDLAHVSDDQLLAHTRRLVGKSNQLLSALLLHLAEIEARGAHRSRRCSSLYTYCIYELRFSEDAAARRSAAARFVREYPPLLDAVAAGELHLTGLLMIGPYLTPENHVDVLARARFRTKKELGRLVRDLNPLPSTPDVIEPLGPALARHPMDPNWRQLASALAPEVRDLPAGERPGDWARASADDADRDDADRDDADRDDADRDDAIRHDVDRDAVTDDALPVGPVPANLPPVTGPQLFQIRFGTVEEHAHLVDRAKALLARTRPRITLGELHLEAMRHLVASLEKQKFAIDDRSHARLEASLGDARTSTEPPRRRGETTGGREPSPEPLRKCGETAESAARTSAPRQRGETSETRARTSTFRQHGETFENRDSSTEPPRQRGEATEDREPSTEPPRQRTRYIPVAVRREVYRRDGARCTYVDARGLRCVETRYLEMHHVQPFARNGAHSASNLALRCSSHNALAAEEDFGRDLVAERRRSNRHEAFAQHQS